MLALSQALARARGLPLAAWSAHTSLVAAYVNPWWVWLLPLFFSAPWIAAILWVWRRRPIDGEISLSMAEQTRKRLWTS